MSELETEKKPERMCFFCSNGHLMGISSCECACHEVEEVVDRLKAIDPDIGWTVPQLYAIKALLESVGR